MQSAEAVDAQERAAFVAWRRELAAVEEGEGLVLTPFEKNLEVWRQLWRVLERSHIIVQARSALRFERPFLPFGGCARVERGASTRRANIYRVVHASLLRMLEHSHIKRILSSTPALRQNGKPARMSPDCKRAG